MGTCSSSNATAPAGPTALGSPTKHNNFLTKSTQPSRGSVDIRVHRKFSTSMHKPPTPTVSTAMSKARKSIHGIMNVMRMTQDKTLLDKKSVHYKAVVGCLENTLLADILNESQIMIVARYCTLSELAGDAHVFRQNEATNAVYFVANGSVRLEYETQATAADTDQPSTRRAARNTNSQLHGNTKQPTSRQQSLQNSKSRWSSQGEAVVDELNSKRASRGRTVPQVRLVTRNSSAGAALEPPGKSQDKMSFAENIISRVYRRSNPRTSGKALPLNVATTICIKQQYSMLSTDVFTHRQKVENRFQPPSAAEAASAQFHAYSAVANGAVTLLTLRRMNIDKLRERHPDIDEVLQQVFIRPLHEHLLSVPQLSAMSAAPVALLAGACQFKTVQPADILCTDGEYTNSRTASMYVLINGQLMATQSSVINVSSADLIKAQYTTLQAPCLINEAACVLNVPSDISVTNSDDTGSAVVCELTQECYSLITGTYCKELIVALTANADAYTSMPLRHLMYSPAFTERFAWHCQAEHSTENVDFYLAVQQYAQIVDPSEQQHLCKQITDLYIRTNALKQVNISDGEKKAILSCVNDGEVSASVFDGAQADVLRLMTQDSYRRFCESMQMKAFVKELAEM